MVPQQEQQQQALATSLSGLIGHNGGPSLPDETELTTAEAAGYLNMSESWLRQTRMRGREGEGPPYPNFRSFGQFGW